MISLLLSLSLISQVEHVIEKDSYRLGPGDKIEVFVESKISYSYATAVDLSGQIEIYSYQFGASGMSMALKTGSGIQIPQPINLVKSGFLYVAGKTISQTETELARRLENVLSGKVKAVRISLLATRTFFIPVLGHVKNPGIYMANPLERVSVLIAQAGGLRSDGDPSKILLVRGDLIIDTVNLNRFAFEGELSANPFVCEGIKVIVPELKNWVTVVGAINGSPFTKASVVPMPSQSSETSTISITSVNRGSSGSSASSNISIEVRVPYSEGLTAKEAINYSGGPQPAADLTSVMLVRNGEKQNIDPDTTHLEPFDTLIVPFNPSHIYVTGQVTTPGAYPFKPGLTVEDYIGMAGGFTDRAKHKVLILDREGKRKKVGWGYEPQAGERIFIPEKTFKWWQDYIYILSVMTSVAVTWLTLSK